MIVYRRSEGGKVVFVSEKNTQPSVAADCLLVRFVKRKRRQA
jgi:hypothetical protein